MAGANYCRMAIISSVLVVFSTALCAAGQPASPLPRVSWEVAEINVTEGCIEIMCFTSDLGSADPYQVNVNARGKGSNPATSDDDYMILSPLNFTIPASELGVRRCVSFVAVDDNLALEELEQFELYFENLPGNFAAVGEQSSLCVNIMDNDVVTIGFERTNITVNEGEKAPQVPTVEWEEREIVVSEGENRLVCFSADIGTVLPYQVLVGVRGKEESSASEADFVLHALLSNMIPVNDKGERFCLNLSIVDDTVGEDSEQFELYFEIIPSEFATVGTNDTVCIIIPKNDAAEFCLPESVIIEGVEYHWPKTTAGVNASTQCQNNPRFSVTRNCNALGTWQQFDPAECGTLSNQLREIRSYLEGELMLSQENITMVIQSLAQFINDTISSPVDHTRENLNDTASILTIIADLVKDQTIVDDTISEAATGIVDSLLQWDQAAIEAQASSTIIQSFEVITSVNAQHLPSTNFIFPFIMLNTQLISLNELQENGSLFEVTDAGVPMPMSISLPPSIFKQLSDTEANSTTGLVFAVYRKSTLFPVGRNALSDSLVDTTTEVGTNVIAASVGRDVEFENLQDPVTITLQLESLNNVSDNVRCVSWDFDLVDWTTRGCTTTLGQNGTVTCACNHLTNFAALVDNCLRQDGCKPLNPIIDTLLTFISYIGIIISITGLILTIITILAFKKLRRKDFAEHHIQFCISLLLMLVSLLILISLTTEKASILYGGCVTISVLVHYFALVAVMWMGAEALLMFRKVVIVFVHITTKYIVTVSLVCWLVPVVPVLVSLIADLSNGQAPADDIIIRRTGGTSLCFLYHPGALWGAFLALVFLIMVFNLVLFIWVVVVMVQHIRHKTVQTDQKLGFRKVIEIIVRLSGVMFLFGLTWIIAILAVVSVPGLRETFQILFTVFNSFQGAFIFLFFCVLNQEARDSWKNVIHKKAMLFQSSNLSHLNETDSTRSTKVNSGSQEHSLSLVSSGAQSSNKLYST